MNHLVISTKKYFSFNIFFCFELFLITEREPFKTNLVKTGTGYYTGWLSPSSMISCCSLAAVTNTNHGLHESKCA